jgi:hypothetical protein
MVLETYKGISRKSPTALIKFLHTGYERIVNVDKAISGEVADLSTSFKIPINTSLLSEYDKMRKLDRIAKEIWRSMIRRCYNSNSYNFSSYGNLGVSVCDRWLSRDNFLDDIKYLPQYEKWCVFPTIYQLDKDYLQLNVPKNERIYSPTTCMFLHCNDNKNIRCIEFKNNNDTLSNYYGITVEGNGKYGVQMTVNNKPIYFGTFNNEIVAAGVYNYWERYFHNYDLVPLLNNVPDISPEEFIKYNVKPKNMCNIINERLDL